jgi:hypothetical protein
MKIAIVALEKKNWRAGDVVKMSCYTGAIHAPVLSLIKDARHVDSRPGK